jgi:hypothetical protein
VLIFLRITVLTTLPIGMLDESETFRIWRFSMHVLARSALMGLGLLTGAVVTAHAQNYPYNTGPNNYFWSPDNYPGYQTNSPTTPYYYYYPGYGYSYNYPTYNYYAGSPYPAPKAYWDPYVALRPYSDNAGPKASGHGSPWVGSPLGK